MKKIIFGAMALAAALVYTSCEKPSTNPDDVDAPEKGTMTISVDKTQIEADGKDIAVFTIKDASGKVLTTEANKGSVFFKNVADGTRLPRYSTGFTSIADGEFEFV